MIEEQKPTRKIFFNYRRADNPDFVERIRDWFAWKYGRDSVFMDFDTIPPFTAFADFIREKVRECDLLVAIIGPQWLDILHDRLAHNDEEDYVQTEIRLALEEGKPIAPICIKKAAIPRARDLPPELRPMLEYHVAHLDSGKHFLDNIEMILEAVERELTKLDALKVMAKVQTVEFDVFAAIQNYQEAADRQDWKVALDWLACIRASDYVPAFYPLDDYEQQAREGLSLQEAERDYNIIRMMAARSSSGKEDPTRIWSALLTFWKAQPGYDPDNLAAQFRPASAMTRLSDSGDLVPLDDLFNASGVVGDLLTLDQALGEGIISGLDTGTQPSGTAVETGIQLPPVFPSQLLSFDEAQSLGLLPDLENQ